MAKLLNIFRSQKRRFSSKSSSSILLQSRTKAIFRSNDSKNSTKKTATAPPIIEAAITYSLSEDEESCGRIVSPNTDIKNPFSTDESEGEIIIENVAFHPPTGAGTKNDTADVEQEDAIKSNQKDSSTTPSENDKTMTFTHAEIMKNEFAHIMQIATKDKEIYELKQAAEDMTLRHTQALASKDNEINNTNKIVVELESALLLVGNELASTKEDYSKTIDVLMKTQHDFHELKASSW
eukprot:CAMPEP_0168251182 /NCGR_PEP_ID=MMETSP0141_2-20121125/2933_1 /TAXON_ID=44445 /ORGANISM="Pseudo-nitzschia australis, Strain 10249 10 AB" /LENGTH=236 /DNA_ID=CAMNT_0008187295 /DNA_START=193 /DNA_END=900 /DNA_ORIENTATION=+